MIEELVKQQSNLQRQVDGLIKPEKSIDLISPFLALPGLVGFWPMSSVQRSTGNAYDLSGQGRTLTYTGNPTYNYYNNYVPYIDFDGVGDYLNRADETDLDIIGNETIYNASVLGLTMGGWFNLQTIPNFAGLMSKHSAANQISYSLQHDGTGTIYSIISTDGTTFVSTGGTVPTIGTWFFAATKFVPSTSLATFYNNTVSVNSTGIPATLFNSTSSFRIGFSNVGASYMDGYASLCFLCSNALNNNHIFSLFQQTRGAFGV